VVAETYLNPWKNTYVKTDRAEGVLLHEFGHAFDKAGTEKISHSPEFLRAYRADVDRLRSQGVSVPSYLLQEGFIGPEETFAELFANLYGYTTCGVDISVLFSECKKEVERAVLLAERG
jgi:hypothetical protein